MTGSSAVESVMTAGRQRWPQLSPDREQLAAAVESCLARVDADSIDEIEVYLACACATGDSAAIAVFEDVYFGSIADALRSMSLDPVRSDEVIQALRVRLFVAEGDEPPRVIRYAGRGQLHGLVRVAAVRIALNALRRDRRTIDAADWLAELPTGGVDPELASLKAEQRAELKRLFEEAVESLEPRERTLLRLSLVERLSIDQVGNIYGVHRATAARWITRARERLSSRTRKLATRRLRVDAEELGEVLELVESQLELSIERLLRSR